jgi:excisionase family DNA binding protein
MTRPELLSTQQAADYLGAQAHTLEIWRATGRHRLPYIKVGRLVRYRRADLDAWLAARTIHAEAAR